MINNIHTSTNLSEKILIDIMHQEKKAQHDALVMIHSCDKCLVDKQCPSEVRDYIVKVESSLKKMRDMSDQFQDRILNAMKNKEDKTSEICDIFNSKLFSEYTKQISKVTSFYYLHDKLCNDNHFSFIANKIKQINPIQFIGLVPGYKEELKKLYNISPSREDVDLALAKVKNILVNWFNR